MNERVLESNPKLCVRGIAAFEDLDMKFNIITNHVCADGNPYTVCESELQQRFL